MLRLPSVAATASSRRTLVSTSTNSASKALYPLRIRSAQCSRLHDCTKTRPIAPSPARLPYQQTRQEHAISNPTLANIEKRWTEMPPQEQAELWMALRDRMTVDWHQMTMQEKRASYWIAFGPHGPRELPPPDENWQIFKGVCQWVGGSAVVFAIIRYFARDPPKTMSREWQEMTNEYLKRENMEPITGISSEGYKGKGAIQSPPRGFKFEKTQSDDDDDE